MNRDERDQAARETVAAAGVDRYTLLIIDDNPTDRETIARFLEHHDGDLYELITAELGEQGVELAFSRPVDCVLTDLRLPDMTGLEVLARLHGDERTRDTPVVVLTGTGNESVAVQAIKQGAHDYLTKEDLSPAGLLRAVTGAINMRRARLGLRESESRFTSLVDVVPVHIWMADRHGALAFLNQHWLDVDGRRFAQLAGRWSEVIHPDDLADFERKLAEGREFQVELRLTDAGGGVRWSLLNGAPRHDERGALLGFVGAAVDVTERRRVLEETEQLNALLEQRVAQRTAELETSNRELEAFSYSVSHDLRAPLRAIDGFSRIVSESEPSLGTDARRYLDRVRTATRQMSELIDDLLSFSRLNRQELRLHRVDTTAVAEAALRTVEAADPEHRATIALHTLPPCHADGRLLEQVFVNLLSNALKYSRAQTEPVVEVGSLPLDAADVTTQGTSPGSTVYYVRDNGVGFDMHYVSKVFGVFQRLHRSEEYEGTGVGLAIVQRIVHRHGGQVWVEAAVDRGATFYFSIPTREAAPAEGGDDAERNRSA